MTEFPLREQLKSARIAADYSQTRLAKEAGVKQSAISMFESGDPHALSAASLKRVAAVLNVTLLSSEAELNRRSKPVLKYCSNFECPSNTPYATRGRLFFKPAFTLAPPEESTHCYYCGLELEYGCPDECGEPVHNAPFCICGAPYVRAPVSLVDPRGWAEAKRAEYREILTLDERQSERVARHDRRPMAFPVPERKDQEHEDVREV